MKPLSTLLFLLISIALFAQKSGEKYLIVRGDDIGSSHAANVGCIETYQNGITTSVELMPPCPWFFEAVKLLNENPNLDVGIHLTLTSEWDYIKWRPLTNCPGLTNEDGDFYPMVWKNENFPANSSISESDWNIDEIEQELRAQIELSLKYVPHCSHISGHMGFASLDESIKNVVEKLAKEFDLYIDMSEVKRFKGWQNAASTILKTDQFCDGLEKMTPGTYLFVEHPAKNFPEMQQIGHIGNRDVAVQRNAVTEILTSKKVKKTIEENGIRLISYAEYKKVLQ